MKKTLLSIVLTVALLLTTVCSVVGSTVSAAAGDAVTYTVQTLEYNAGSTIAEGTEFTINVSSSAINAVQVLQLKLMYDSSVMQAVKGEAKGWLAAFEFMPTVNVAPVAKDHAEANVGEVWITGMSLNNQKAAEGDVVATITFKALKDITTDQAVSVYFAMSGENVGNNQPTAYHSCQTVNGGVAFISNRVPGDVTLDGQVNVRDIILIRRYLVNEAEITGQAFLNGDVTHDGALNVRDIILIRRSMIGEAELT